jgi:NAD(P)-dependent dehydrogenase (short-subunit alcohol dehydrogenase family)
MTLREATLHLMGVYVVSGSAGGIGGAVRQRIEAEGNAVIGVDVHDAEVPADLSTAEGRTAAVAAASEQAGGALDGVVAAAGLGGSCGAASSTIVRVNYFGALAMLDGLLPLLRDGAQPAAVAVASNSAGVAPTDDLVDTLLAGDEVRAAQLADETDGENAYMRAKLALARAVRRRAQTWGEAGVRLNAISPGPVLTPLLQTGLDHPVTGPMIRQFPIPLGRWGEKEEIADGVWFLLTNGWTHGAVLFVDGGTDALLNPDRL